MSMIIFSVGLRKVENASKILTKNQWTNALEYMNNGGGLEISKNSVIGI